MAAWLSLSKGKGRLQQTSGWVLILAGLVLAACQTTEKHAGFVSNGAEPAPKDSEYQPSVVKEGPQKGRFFFPVDDGMFFYPAPKWFGGEGDSNTHIQQGSLSTYVSHFPKREGLLTWQQLLLIEIRNLKPFQRPLYVPDIVEIVTANCAPGAVHHDTRRTQKNERIVVVACGSHIARERPQQFNPDRGSVTVFWYTQAVFKPIYVQRVWLGPRFDPQDEADWPVSVADMDRFIDNLQHGGWILPTHLDRRERAGAKWALPLKYSYQVVRE